MAATTGATIESINDVLKEFYISPLQEQLNNEVMVLELFEKAKISWAGKQGIVPVHVSRNTGVSFKAEDADLQASGKQGVNRLVFTAAYLYGRFEVTGPAIASAAKGGTASFIGALELEMDKLKNDIRDKANRTLVSGGSLVGFLHQKQTTTGAGTEDWEFRGDYSKIGDALTEKGGAFAVKLIDLSNSTLTASTTAYEYLQAGETVALSAADGVAGTVTLADVDSAAANTDTTGVSAGYAIGVEIADAGVEAFDSEPIGIYGNMALRSHFTVERDHGTTTGSTELQSIVLSQSTADSTGDTTDADLSLERMQQCLDSVLTVSGMESNLIMMHPAQRTKYIGLLNGNVWQLADKATTGDGGFLGLSYGGIPIKTSRHVDNGIVIFMETKCWKLAVLEDGKFADLDGNVLSRVTGKDNWEGFYKWYYNHYCYRPNAQVLLTGLTII